MGHRKAANDYFANQRTKHQFSFEWDQRWRGAHNGKTTPSTIASAAANKQNVMAEQIQLLQSTLPKLSLSEWHDAEEEVAIEAEVEPKQSM